MTALPAITWFNRATPVSAIGASSVVIGGTHLLDEFMRMLQEYSECFHLTIVTPFIDQESVTFLRQILDSKRHLVSLDVLTAPSMATAASMTTLISAGWKTCRVAARRGLHSKIYLARGRGGRAVALLGSHNLTSAGREANFEAGVLLHGNDPGVAQVVTELEEAIGVLRDRAKTISDSTDMNLGDATSSSSSTLPIGANLA